MQFTHFCRDFDLVAKYASYQALSCINFLPPGSASDSRTGTPLTDKIRKVVFDVFPIGRTSNSEDTKFVSVLPVLLVLPLLTHLLLPEWFGRSIPWPEGAACRILGNYAWRDGGRKRNPRDGALCHAGASHADRADAADACPGGRFGEHLGGGEVGRCHCRRRWLLLHPHPSLLFWHLIPRFLSCCKGTGSSSCRKGGEKMHIKLIFGWTKRLTYICMPVLLLKSKHCHKFFCTICPFSVVHFEMLSDLNWINLDRKWTRLRV